MFCEKCGKPLHPGAAFCENCGHSNPVQPAEATPVEAAQPTADDAASRVKQLMEQGLSRKDAIKQTAQELNLPKNVVDDAALNI